MVKIPEEDKLSNEKRVRVSMPVEMQIRSVLDNNILWKQEDTLPLSLTEKEIHAIEHRVKQEHISYETALVEFYQRSINSLAYPKKVLADLQREFPQYQQLVFELKLMGKITWLK